MTDPTIICPSCSMEIKLTESLAGPLIGAMREKLEAKLSKQTLQVCEWEKVLKKKEADITAAQNNIEVYVAKQIEVERVKIAKTEMNKAKMDAASNIEAKTKELSVLNDILKTKDEKLAEAQEQQVELLKNKRDLDDQKRELELTIEKRVQETVLEVRKQAKMEVESELRLKISEKEEKITSMMRQIEILKRKAEQGSQQLQGEVFELELEGVLRAKFQFDNIDPVPKGEFGGDVIQNVISPTGQLSGTILWELKRTKNWSDGWLAKLRKDQRTAKAQFSILVSVVLPKGIDNFGLVDGVWVSAPRYAVPLVIALRQTLIEVAQSKQSQEGQKTKMELIYNYLMGPTFKHRIEAIVEKISDMQADLDREKKAMMRLWAKRDGQIQSVIEATVGMYGDFQGIAGRALQEIEGLEVPLIGKDSSLLGEDK